MPCADACVCIGMHACMFKRVPAWMHMLWPLHIPRRTRRRSVRLNQTDRPVEMSESQVQLFDRDVSNASWMHDPLHAWIWPLACMTMALCMHEFGFLHAWSWPFACMTMTLCMHELVSCACMTMHPRSACMTMILCMHDHDLNLCGFHYWSFIFLPRAMIAVRAGLIGATRGLTGNTAGLNGILPATGMLGRSDVWQTWQKRTSQISFFLRFFGLTCLGSGIVRGNHGFCTCWSACKHMNFLFESPSGMEVLCGQWKPWWKARVRSKGFRFCDFVSNMLPKKYLETIGKKRGTQLYKFLEPGVPMVSDCSRSAHCIWQDLCMFTACAHNQCHRISSPCNLYLALLTPFAVEDVCEMTRPVGRIVWQEVLLWCMLETAL